MPSRPRPRRTPHTLALATLTAPCATCSGTSGRRNLSRPSVDVGQCSVRDHNPLLKCGSIASEPSIFELVVLRQLALREGSEDGTAH